MKPKNFPARKNQRRIIALENLMIKIPLQTKKDVAEMRILRSKIIPYDEARAIRTKKYRGSK